MADSGEELLNSPSRILCFNECLLMNVYCVLMNVY